MPLSEADLILNPDGSIYHLNLLPQDIADVIITVGDPDRVKQVSNHFDKIELSKQKREFYTVTGIYKDKRLTVISTGIGTDNIDIVLNELDALANINFKERLVNPQFRDLTFVRIGTSGALQPEIEVDSFLISEYAIGLDSLMKFYNLDWEAQKDILQKNWNDIDWLQQYQAYVIGCDRSLLDIFRNNKIRNGITITCPGFYGPQFRKLRLRTKNNLNNYSNLSLNGENISNLEMETSGIYALSKLLGHKAISLNAILANRATGKFSKKPEDTVDALIRYGLDKIAQL